MIDCSSQTISCNTLKISPNNLKISCKCFTIKKETEMDREAHLQRFSNVFECVTTVLMWPPFV